MGAVYRAARDDGELHHSVAIKIVAGWLPGPAALQRFRSERQILASLDHPYIARLLDAGTTESGVPFAVMEYVDGQPLDGYCTERRLTIADRLAVFLKICEAVEYAHRNLIVHRDLKPANILVTDAAVPKLLDFGIAKLLGNEGAEAVTRTGVTPLTPHYASPEQVTAAPIGTPSDIYALGVILYELLAGASPYGNVPASALGSAIVDGDIERPSRSIDAAAATERGMTPGRLRRRLSGDLDNIVLMALRKEPERRYATVRQFADDIANYLSERPVSARRSSIGYRAGKLVRRHPAGVAAGLGFALAITSLTAFYTNELRIERDRAEREAAKATNVSEFLRGVFESADPERVPNAEVTARELLDSSARRIDAELGSTPEVQADLLAELGRVYRSLGLFEDAEDLLTRAVSLRRVAEQPGDVALADVLHVLGTVLVERSRYADAELPFREAIVLRRPAGDIDALASSMEMLAWAHLQQSEFTKADSLLDEALVLLDTNERDNGLALARVLQRRAQSHQMQGRFEPAETLHLRSLDLLETEVGPDDLLVARQSNGLATTYAQHGKLAEAQRYYERAVDIFERVLGADHPSVAAPLGNLGIVYVKQGRMADAEHTYERALAIREAALGPDHADVGGMLNNLAMLYRRGGRLDDADARYQRALAIAERVYGSGNPRTAIPMFGLAILRSLQGETDEAWRLHQQVLEIRERALGPGHPQVAQSLYRMGMLHLDAGRADEAEPLLARALAIQEAVLVPGEAQMLATVDAYARALETLDRSQERDALQARFVQARADP